MMLFKPTVFHMEVNTVQITHSAS